MSDFVIRYRSEYHSGISKVYAVDPVKERFLIAEHNSNFFYWVPIDNSELLTIDDLLNEEEEQYL